MPETIIGENVVTLHIRFAAYEALLEEVGDEAGARLAYDGEVLEIMSPSPDHENCNRLLEALVRSVALEWHVDVESRGSVTLKQKPRGVEPDSCFYVTNAARISGRMQLDWSVDPPPDIVVEIDISRARLDKRAIHAAVGIPECWLYDGERLRAFDLRGAMYTEISASEQLANLSIGEVSRFLAMRNTLGQSEILRMWQAWLREDYRP